MRAFARIHILPALCILTLLCGAECHAIKTAEEGQHQVLFYVDGELAIPVQYLNAGEAITIPANPSDISGKTFVGWSELPMPTVSDTKPQLATPASTMGDHNLTYHAVFATKHAESWCRISTLSEVKYGTYVIICDGFYLPSTETGGSTAPSAKPAPAITDGIITDIVADDMIWYLSVSGKRFYIRNAGDRYLYEINNNNGLHVGTRSDTWTITENTPGYFSLQGYEYKRYCAKYKAGNDWRSYNAANHESYANGGKLELFKHTPASYSDYCTSVSSTPIIEDTPHIHLSSSTTTSTRYNLQGQPLPSSTRGLIITHGRKVMRK